MSIKRYIWFPVVAFLLFVARGMAQSTITNITPDFSAHYANPPKTFMGEVGLDSFVALQTSDSRFTDNRKALIVISAMLPKSEGCSANIKFITQSGREMATRDIVDWAFQGGDCRQLSNQDIMDLREDIQKLPRKSVFPPIEQLTIASFRDGSHWITRCYDQQHPPDALTDIYKIISGARLVTEEEIEAEHLAESNRMIVAARAAASPGPAFDNLALEDAVSKSIAIFTATLTNLQGPLDAQFGEARYYGMAIPLLTLRGPVPNPLVAIDARLLPSYHEDQPDIFIAVKTPSQPGSTLGANYTAIKFLPATDANIAKVKELIGTGTAPK